ncbi:MAG: FG-GAP-like repeat-containing protein [Polaribacter sp.]|nr:FG-GAP-like repeat-containing protein [Polaribacter sp.]
MKIYKKNHILFFFGLLMFQVFLVQSQTFELKTNRFKNLEMKDNMGVSVVDYNGDFALDIFIVGNKKDDSTALETYSRLFKNNNDGTFTDVTLESGLFGLYDMYELNANNTDDTDGYTGYKMGASWGDYNNDGHPDLFLTNAFKVQLFKNNGNGTFTDITEAAGFLKSDNCNNTSAAWFDFNNDGNLDIYISDYKSDCGNRLYKNLGDSTFIDVTASAGLDLTNKNTYMAFPFDVNEDGLMDLYVINDFVQTNELYVNKNGTFFVEKGVDYGLDIQLNSMGISTGDYDLDGNYDFLITDVSENVVLKGKNDNTFEIPDKSHIYLKSEWGWNNHFSDFDNDGDEDVLIAAGYFKAINAYYKNSYRNGGSSMTNVTLELGLTDVNITHSSAVFDYDNDGDLDIYFSNLEAVSVFYDNTLMEDQSTANWLKIKLEGSISNRDGIGTQVEIDTDYGTQIRYYTGVGLYSQNQQSVHFGIGADTSVLELRIKWPSGIIDTYSNIAVNQHIKAIEGNSYEILSISPSVKKVGCMDSTSCNFNPEAIIDDGSCTYLAVKEITGNTAAHYLTEESYTYPLGTTSTIVWQVEGGKLIDGQGTEAITVHWEVADKGKVTAVETDNCSSPPVELSVSLSAADVSVDGNASIARLWNEVLLSAIRKDFARPTIHARNLFHAGIAMYDSWAIYNAGISDTFLLGKTMGSYFTSFGGFTNLGNISENRSKTLSYAVYRLLNHRFKNSPGAIKSLALFDLLMDQMGYDKDFTSTDYSTNDPAAMGNYIGKSLINFGFVDGSREVTGYDNGYYQAVNEPLPIDLPGNTYLTYPNRWQPLSFETFIDQSGNLISGSTPDFLSPEWGNVIPFSLQDSNKQTFVRDGDTYKVYHDPGTPPFMDITAQTESGDQYKWGFSLVSIWGGHLDAEDRVMLDISPKSLGNIPIENLPSNFSDYPDFYDTLEGGDIGTGYAVNPKTNAAYKEQLVPRGDYTRVLAEFWADGPDSETPPGHWFTLMNYVSDHDAIEKKFEGTGAVLSDLEWDIKSYFLLGGAMHDAAIASWSIKGWYDYIRPVSAIRYMAELGQSTDTSQSNYHIGGIPLVAGRVEVVKIGDVLAGASNEHVGKVKLYTWKGHDFIADSSTDAAGVGWILAENWMPYQRSSFVTPPFAGYVSGHSTYSRAAAEMLTRITGDAYFPGGMGEFVAKKGQFLVFEKGPSQDVILQWATYRDASDQCSLSRIWGGIHPPFDDIPGRIIGEQIGIDAFEFGKAYFNKTLSVVDYDTTKRIVYPNPIVSNVILISNTKGTDTIALTTMLGEEVEIKSKRHLSANQSTEIIVSKSIPSGVYILTVNEDAYKIVFI